MVLPKSSKTTDNQAGLEENDQEEFKSLLTQAVRKLMIIFGPEISLAKARNVSGLKIDESGEVLKVEGMPREVLDGLTEEYAPLSDFVIDQVLKPLALKYPPPTQSAPEVMGNGEKVNLS